MKNTSISDRYLDLFQKPAFGHFATIMPDGSPQVTPVWVDYENGYVLVNTSLGRQKDKNIRREKRVAIEIMDPDNPYRYIEIRGEVETMIEEGADAHIDKMAKKYIGKDHYPYRKPGEVRVIVKIKPTRVVER